MKNNKQYPTDRQLEKYQKICDKFGVEKVSFKEYKYVVNIERQFMGKRCL